MSEKTRAKYEKVETLRKAGATTDAACKQVGATSSGYYAWRLKYGKNKRKRAKVKEVTFPQLAITSGKAFMIFGSPTELAEFARVYQ